MLLNSLLFAILVSPTVFANSTANVPVLCYHNFDPTSPGSMTITTQKFESQLKWLKDNGYTVIPMKELVSYLEGKTPKIPAKSVVITVDDGKLSVYKYMLPIVRKYDVPVTLFVYPSAISNASYAMTWDQLRELQKTGLFDIQSHTYWHPNFKQEKKRLSPSEYQKLVHTQLASSKKVLDQKLNTNVTVLAWPYGIYDAQLEQAAADAGYVMAFSIDERLANKTEKSMSQPRYMITTQNMNEFAAIVSGQAPATKQGKTKVME